MFLLDDWVTNFRVRAFPEVVALDGISQSFDNNLSAFSRRLEDVTYP